MTSEENRQAFMITLFGDPRQLLRDFRFATVVLRSATT